jgi:ketosteroid isomerase-like protein
MEHPNVTLYRNLMASFDSGDVEAMEAAVAPDVRWHEAGNPDVIVGRDAVRELFMQATGTLENDVDVHDVLANDDHVVALLQVKLQSSTGERVEYPVVEIAHVVDGQVTERWAFMDACPADVTGFFAALST